MLRLFGDLDEASRVRTEVGPAAYTSASSRPTGLLPSPSCVVYTPRSLAQAMVRALARRGETKNLEWLEPSVGSGIFLRALARRRVPRERIQAIDLDPTPQAADDLARTSRPTEFLEWAAATDQRFDRIVGNPPFIAVRKLPPPLRSRAAEVRDPTGEPAGLRANLWFCFLCTSIRLLKPSGSLGFVLPASWEYADYAERLRINLREHFATLDIFRCSERLFPTVQDGSIVLIARGYGGGPGSHRLHSFKSPRGLLQALSKPTRAEARAARTTRKPAQLASSVKLSDVATIRIGIVTGDVGFFLLSEDRRRELGIPVAACRPVLSRARHIATSFVTQSHWQALRKAGERIWLFAPSPELARHQRVRAYMEQVPDAGGCRRDRLKIRKRTTWYRPHLPPACNGFISGMAHNGPWIAFRKMPRLTASNTLYLISFKARLPPWKRFAIALGLLTSGAREQTKRITRIYPDGLRKIEPAKLASVRLPVPTSPRGALTTYKAAVRLLVQGRIAEAENLADRWMHEATRGS